MNIIPSRREFLRTTGGAHWYGVIWHISWGGVDVPNEYLWWMSKGMDAHVEIYPLDTGHASYWNGPDKEVIEINTQGHHRYSPVHLFAKDFDVSGDWFTRHLELPDRFF